jgi:hypothetical protein
MGNCNMIGAGCLRISCLGTVAWRAKSNVFCGCAGTWLHSLRVRNEGRPILARPSDSDRNDQEDRSDDHGSRSNVLRALSVDPSFGHRRRQSRRPADPPGPLTQWLSDPCKCHLTDLFTKLFKCIVGLCCQEAFVPNGGVSA